VLRILNLTISICTYADHKCLQPRVWKWRRILAFCPWAYYYCTCNLTAAYDGTVEYKASFPVNTICHCSSCTHYMIPYLLQHPLQICICRISIAGLWLFAYSRVDAFLVSSSIDLFCKSPFSFHWFSCIMLIISYIHLKLL
jgi:hypothetical protein